VELNLLNTIEFVELQSQQHTAINAFQAQILQRDAQVLALQQETRALRQQLARQDQELTAANNRLGAR
jgi:capsule polysaccharide export protein KpsE/RkpR